MALVAGNRMPEVSDPESYWTTISYNCNYERTLNAGPSLCTDKADPVIDPSMIFKRAFYGLLSSSSRAFWAFHQHMVMLTGMCECANTRIITGMHIGFCTHDDNFKILEKDLDLY